MVGTPEIRIRRANASEPRPDGDYVLYWMIASRRARANFALGRAIELAKRFDTGVVVLEALRTAYPWASDRLHTFVLQGMVDNGEAFAKSPVHYYPYVEPEHGAGAGLLEALAQRAVAVVTDDFPCFFLPRMVEQTAARLSVACEVVDSNGILPMAQADGRAFPTAYGYRRYMQKNVGRALHEQPSLAPLPRLALPDVAAKVKAVEKRWPRAVLDDLPKLVATLPIDHGVSVARGIPGGSVAARMALQRFVKQGLPRYAEDRNHPDEQVTSGLSPYLHFGHIGAYEIFHAVCSAEGSDGMPKGSKRDGSREGFWGLSVNAEAFLDQLVTWRELSFNTAANVPNFDAYESLPGWAKDTLSEHAKDPRERVYTQAELEDAKTYDPVWNAAQRELRQTGALHNYMRMLWGKKILEWSTTPEMALERMVYLNNKYAVDGRDPNSYSGIFWTLGRYDRPWGPKRPIFGSIRYMSSDSAKRKLHLSRYLERFGSDPQLRLGELD